SISGVASLEPSSTSTISTGTVLSASSCPRKKAIEFSTLCRVRPITAALLCVGTITDRDFMEVSNTNHENTKIRPASRTRLFLFRAFVFRVFVMESPSMAALADDLQVASQCQQAGESAGRQPLSSRTALVPRQAARVP